MKPRPIAKLRRSLERRLTAYTIAASGSGLGLLMWSPPAAARIVYTRAHQELQSGVPVPLDLNHDRMVDFSLFFSGFSEYGGFAVSVKAAGTNKVAGYCQHLSRECWASALPPAIRVGPNQRFGPYGLMVLGDCGRSYCGARGPWKQVQNRYLGFDFLVKGKPHYGWARLNVSFEVGSVAAVLTGYAYETVPNKPLVTGKTKGPDVIRLEPGTLGQLARGADAILK